jgi:hypothetical protein
MIQHTLSRTAVQAMFSGTNPFGQATSPAGSDESCRSIKKHDIPSSAIQRTGQNHTGNLGILLGIPPT